MIVSARHYFRDTIEQQDGCMYTQIDIEDDHETDSRMREATVMERGSQAIEECNKKHRGGSVHVQCHHQRMQEGKAVDHGSKLAAGDAAVEHGG